MASWVALIVALLSMAVTVPLALLQRVLGAVGVPQALVQLVHLPLSRLAALVALAGVAVQTSVLLEEYGADHVGLWLNSLASSSSNGSTRSVPARAAHLTFLALESYPRTLSLVLDDALALPVPAPDSGITFSAADVDEWERDSASFRADWTQLADEVAQAWMDLLDWAPSSTPSTLADPDTAARSSSPSSSPSPSSAGRHLFLSLVAAELALVQSRNPTRAVYADREYSPADFALEDARQAARAERAAAKRDADFEQWLEGIFAGAEAAQAGADASGAPSEGQGGTAKGAAALRRELLDVPVGDGPGSGTWRTVLRTSWEGMYAADKGGILGEVAQHLGGLLGDDEDEDEDEGATTEGDWTPSPLPLMAHRLVRDQLSATIDAAVRIAGWDLFPSPTPEHDAAILPSGLDALPFDRLTLAQLALAIDRRARTWAQRALNAVRPSRSPPPHDPAALSSAERAGLLRASPLARFLRATNALFALPSERMRIGVSDHVAAQAVFALQVPAVEVPLWQRREGEGSRQGGCSAVVLEKEKRKSPEAWESARREIERRRGTELAQDEGLLEYGAQAHTRDEL